MKYVFLVFMIFSAGEEQARWNYGCPDMACVEEVISHFGESERLVRLRVYEASVQVSPTSQIPIGTPLIDLWFQ